MSDAETVDSANFLIEAKGRLARAFVAAYGPDRGEEALAEAMAYAWVHRDRLVRMSNPVGYLYRVGQSRTRGRRLDRAFPPPADVGLPEIEPKLVAAVGALSERQRVCTLLVHAFEWTQAEVADLLGISPSSVHRHIERGLRALRITMGRVDE